MISNTKENKMAHLIYYQKENEAFKDAFGRQMDWKESEMVYPKLCRHFKLRRVRLEWTSGRNHPSCASWRITLNYNWNNFGILCHELAHLFMYQKIGKGGHNKKHWRVMKRMICYCQKKNWFEEELKRRTEPKPVKPDPTKEEIRLKKIERFERGIKRHQTKIKRCTTLIKKNNRRIAHLRRFI